MRTITKAFWVFTTFLLLSGCRDTVLHHNLEETEVDEIMVALQSGGIEAKKEKEITGQDVSWNVSVPDKDLSKARQILIINHLPRRRELGLSGVYKEKGLIPTPDEQKARFLLALKGEIINSLQKIPGVVDADVVLNVPTESEFADLDAVKKKPTASVVVKTRNEESVSQSVTEGKLQRFVANSVPNLDPNDVAVIVTRIETGLTPLVANNHPALLAPTTLMAPNAGDSDTQVPPEEAFQREMAPSSGLVDLAGLRMEPDSVGRFKVYMIGLLSLLVAVSVFLLFNIVRLNRMKLKVQRGARTTRTALANDSQGLLGGGSGGSEGVEGTFDVGAGRRQG